MMRAYEQISAENSAAPFDGDWIGHHPLEETPHFTDLPFHMKSATKVLLSLLLSHKDGYI